MVLKHIEDTNNTQTGGTLFKGKGENAVVVYMYTRNLQKSKFEHAANALQSDFFLLR